LPIPLGTPNGPFNPEEGFGVLLLVLL